MIRGITGINPTKGQSITKNKMFTKQIKSMELPSKITLGILGITGADNIKAHTTTDQFVMKCGEYEGYEGPLECYYQSYCI